MTTLEQTWSRVGFEEPLTVERLLVRGALAGGLTSGALAWLGHLTKVRLPSVEIVMVTSAVLLMVLPRQRLGARLAAGGAAFLLMCFSGSPALRPLLFTGALGLLLAMEPASWVRKGVAAVGPSLGAAWCLLVEPWLRARHLGSGAALSWLALLGSGLFISIGAALCWVSFAADAVEPQLVGQPKVRLAWLRLRAALQQLPKGEPREQLEALAYEGAARYVKARAERDELARALDQTAEASAREAVEALEARIEETDDAELKSHLGQLLRVHRDTLEEFDGLSRKVERLEARAAAEAGWLETAAFSVQLAPRHADGARELAVRLRGLHGG